MCWSPPQAATLLHPTQALCLCFSTVPTNLVGREDGGSHSKTLRSNVPPEKGLNAPVAFCGWTLVEPRFKASSGPCGAGCCPDAGEKHLIRLTDLVHGSEAHCPLLKTGFSEHKSAGDTGQMGSPRRRARGREAPAWQAGRCRHCHPSPSQFGFPLCWADKGQLVTLAKRWAEELAKHPWAKANSEEGQ